MKPQAVDIAMAEIILRKAVEWLFLLAIIVISQSGCIFSPSSDEPTGIQNPSPGGPSVTDTSGPPSSTAGPSDPLDADTLDGKDSADFAAASHGHGFSDLIIDPTTAVTGLNCDLLDGKSAENFMLAGSPSPLASDLQCAGCVDGAEIANGAIRASHIASGSVGSLQIAEGAVTNSRLASNSVGTSKIAPGWPGMVLMTTAEGITAWGLPPAQEPPKAFAKVLGVSQLVPDYSTTTLSFRDEIYDTGNLFRPDQPDRLTAPLRGLYHVTAQIRVSEADRPLGYRIISIKRNGLFTIGRVTAAAAQYGVYQASADTMLDAGEHITVTLFQETGGSLQVLGGDQWLSQLQMHLVSTP